MQCIYCNRDITATESYELFGGEPVHIHCFQILGAELTETPWEEMLPREQDAINTYLSVDSQEQQEVV